MRADIFCRVIDNFGDIGVTWRIARQLVNEHGWSVRLWVDDLAVLARLEQRASASADSQLIEGIRVLPWPDSRAPCQAEPSPVVIAAFSCEPPPDFTQRMRESQSVLVNLEYLSAEDWVAGCHQLPAFRADGLRAYYFFPGFTKSTGGLPRERGLEVERQTWIADRTGQRALLVAAGLTADGIHRWESDPAMQLVTLFCYPHAPVDRLFAALAQGARQTLVLIAGHTLPELQAESLGRLRTERIRFLPQAEYDRLLWMADLNFVRGEDSIVRGIWAGKPLVWHIYPQEKSDHLAKLEAWLSLSGLPEPAKQAIRCWNAPSSDAAADTERLKQALDADAFASWSYAAQSLMRRLHELPGLTHELDRFCRSLLGGDPVRTP